MSGLRLSRGLKRRPQRRYKSRVSCEILTSIKNIKGTSFAFDISTALQDLVNEEPFFEGMVLINPRLCQRRWKRFTD
jgi:hypothetical protein